jgi:predicted metal-dependent phosphoesterase TrpH
MSTRYADFHAHTTASDGTATPEELVRTAAEAGVDYLAVTDHDTAKGVPAAIAEAARLGTIRILPGVEISARGKPGSCHLLGLGIDPDHPALNGTLTDLLAARTERNLALAERLTRLGAPLTIEEVTTYAPVGANVGRPHFALALLGKGYVRSLQEAFDKYLGDTGAAFVPKDDLSPADAIALIHDVGGLCFLAHPGLLKLAEHETMETRIKAYAAVGMDGIEAYYSRHSLPQQRQFLRIAEKFGLLVTGGSDYHGTNRPGTVLNGVLDEGREPLPADRIAPILLERVINPNSDNPKAV